MTWEQKGQDLSPRLDPRIKTPSCYQTYFHASSISDQKRTEHCCQSLEVALTSHTKTSSANHNHVRTLLAENRQTGADVPLERKPEDFVVSKGHLMSTKKQRSLER